MPTGHESTAARVPLTQLEPSALNPRRTFNQVADAELFESIQAHGILTPILVRPVEPLFGQPNAFEIVAGHRRYAVAKALGFEDVPVTIRDLTDDQAREAALIENLQREDLAPLDEATAYEQLLSRPGQTPAMVAAAVGKSPGYIGRRLKLLTLVPDAQAALREDRLSVAHAELLTKLDAKTQARALDEAVWLPMFRRDGSAEDRNAHHLEPIAELRKWVERRTKLDLADREALALFPDADELVKDISEKSASSPIAPPLEIALDRFGISPAKVDIPAGVLRLNTDFRQVVGKKCTFARRAIVVFGDCLGDVVTVCVAKKSCTTHWPPAVKADPAAKAAKRPSWEQVEAERKREQRIFERIVPDLRKAIVLATARVKTTPKELSAILGERHAPNELAAAVAAVGKLTTDTFARVHAVAEAFGRLYNLHGAEFAVKELRLDFDLKKAMKAAEAAMTVEASAAKAETKKVSGAKKPIKKSRAA